MALTEIVADEIAINGVLNGITQHVGDISNGNKILYSNNLELNFVAATDDVVVTIASQDNPYDGFSKTIAPTAATAGTPVAIGHLTNNFANGQYVEIAYSTSTGTITVEAIRRSYV